MDNTMVCSMACQAGSVDGFLVDTQTKAVDNPFGDACDSFSLGFRLDSPIRVFPMLDRDIPMPTQWMLAAKSHVTNGGSKATLD